MPYSLTRKTARTLLGCAGVSGLLLVFTPHALFPVCTQQIATAAGGLVPMKCAWTARMLVALGLLSVALAVAGVLTSHLRAVTAYGLSIAAVLGVAMLVPTRIIGVCAAPIHPCRAGMLPAVLAETTVGIVFAVGAVLAAANLREDSEGAGS